MKRINIPTLIAISIIAWILVNIFHEIVGHAGFGILSGLSLKAANTTTAYFDVNWDYEISQNGFSRYRIFLLGGVLVNFLTGFIAWLLLKFKSSINSQLNLFLWLFTSFSLVIIVMNLISVPLIGGGDLVGVIRTFDNQNLAKIIVLILGIFVMITGYLFLQRSFMPKLNDHRSIILSLTIIPILTLIIIQSLSLLKSPFAYLPPSQNHLLASVFAYFHFILWAVIVNIFPFSNKMNSIENISLEKSISWIILSIILLFFFIFILGPGIGSFDGHPSL